MTRFDAERYKEEGGVAACVDVDECLSQEEEEDGEGRLCEQVITLIKVQVGEGGQDTCYRCAPTPRAGTSAPAARGSDSTPATTPPASRRSRPATWRGGTPLPLVPRAAAAAVWPGEVQSGPSAQMVGLG